MVEEQKEGKTNYLDQPKIMRNTKKFEQTLAFLKAKKKYHNFMLRNTKKF
jgi:hypothetical protein